MKHQRLNSKELLMDQKYKEMINKDIYLTKLYTGTFT